MCPLYREVLGQTWTDMLLAATHYIQTSGPLAWQWILAIVAAIEHSCQGGWIQLAVILRNLQAAPSLRTKHNPVRQALFKLAAAFTHLVTSRIPLKQAHGGNLVI